eukprot:COSAG03_NODE_2028_length_3205_cov_8.768191_1_plen_127_part_00
MIAGRGLTEAEEGAEEDTKGETEETTEGEREGERGGEREGRGFKGLRTVAIRERECRAQIAAVAVAAPEEEEEGEGEMEAQTEAEWAATEASCTRQMDAESYPAGIGSTLQPLARQAEREHAWRRH